MITSIIIFIMEMFNTVHFHNKWFTVELFFAFISYWIIFFSVMSKLVSIIVCGFSISVLLLALIYSVPNIILNTEKINNIKYLKNVNYMKMDKFSEYNLNFYTFIIDKIPEKTKSSIIDHKDSKKLLSNVSIGIVLFIGIIFSMFSAMNGDSLDIYTISSQFQNSNNVILKSFFLELKTIFPLVYAVYATHLIINSNLKNLININSHYQ